MSMSNLANVLSDQGKHEEGGRDASTSAEAEGDGANLLLGVHVHDFGVGGHKDRRV
jgi:hypothetical protein